MQKTRPTEMTSEIKDTVLQNISIPEIILTPEEIELYIAHKESEGCVAGTIDAYRRDMQRLYQMLPENKDISQNTVRLCKEQLVEKGYAKRTINFFVSVANNYLEYKGARQYQLNEKRTHPKDLVLPELTRAEYLRLLSTARTLGRERVYLLVKLFACTGVQLQELDKITVEAVQAKKATIISSRVGQVVRIPDVLCTELLSYAQHQGISSGPIFLTREKTPMSRTNVSMGIRQLCVSEQVPVDKGNPRCLRKLYLSTRAGIEANINLLVEQAQNRLWEEEQLTIGWEEK